MKAFVKFQNVFSEDLRKLDDSLKSENISPIAKLSSHECMNIYHKAYFARLTETLGDTYSAVWRVLGDDHFFEVTRDYIQNTPSIYYDLSDYGETFPKYLCSVGDKFKAPFLYDLARFELEFKNLFHQRQNKPLSKEELAYSLKEGDLIFLFGSAFKLFKSDYPIHDIWKNRESEKFDMESLDWKIREHLVLYKNKDRIFIRKITEMEFCFLEMLKEGQSVLRTLKSVTEESKVSEQKSTEKYLERDNISESQITKNQTEKNEAVGNKTSSDDFERVQNLMRLVSELNCVEAVQKV